MMAAATEKLCCSMLHAAGPCNQVFCVSFQVHEHHHLHLNFQLATASTDIQRAKHMQHLSGALWT